MVEAAAPLKGSPKYFRVVLTVVLILVMALTFILIWLLQSLFIIASYFFISKERREDVCGLIFRFLVHFCTIKLNPFWRIRRLNKCPKVTNKKVIVMVNHLCAADPFVACGSLLPRDGSWVAKNELFAVPIGGWQLVNAGDLSVQFKKKTEGFAVVPGTVGPMIEEARKKLRRGRMVCIFPEGTRNPNPEGELCPFRLGFFQLAIEEGATIIPLTLSGTQRLWPYKSSLVDSATAYTSFCEPIEVAGFRNAQALADHVRTVLTNQRESHPDRVGMANLKAN